MRIAARSTNCENCRAGAMHSNAPDMTIRRAGFEKPGPPVMIVLISCSDREEDVWNVR